MTARAPFRDPLRRLEGYADKVMLARAAVGEVKLRQFAARENRNAEAFRSQKPQEGPTVVAAPIW